MTTTRQPPGQPAISDAAAWGLFHAGKTAEAAAQFEALVADDPKRATALHGLALIAHLAGRNDQARALIERALAVRNDDAEMHYHCGRILRRLGRDAEAATSYQRAVDLRPEYWEAHSSLGIVCKTLGRLEDAIASQRRALALKPDFAEGWLNLGNALLTLGDTEATIDAYQRVLRIDAGHSRAVLGLATAQGYRLLEQDRATEARPLFLLALKQHPEVPALHCGLGMAEWQLGNYQQARTSFDRALALRPDDRHACTHLATMLSEQGLTEEALKWFAAALALMPDNALLHNDHGVALLNSDRVAESAAAFERGLALSPGLKVLEYNKAIPLLLQGQLRAGFAHYEARFEGSALWRDRAPPDFRVPRWDGRTSLQGRRLLLWAEQGLGDTLQFVRYLPQLAALGPARISLHVQEPLLRLLAPCFPQAEFVAMGAEVRDVDIECPLMSLPHLLGIDAESTLAELPYLEADPLRLARWARELADAAPAGTPGERRRRIGLVWGGNPDHPRDRERSLALKQLLPLAMNGAQFISLQKGPAAAEMAQVPELGLLPLAERFEDFADTAAVVAQLDLVISVDTSVAHLAGALARPTWLLLTRVPDWRWMLERDDSPWYPGMRLFRQPQRGHWGPVIDRLVEALSELPAVSDAPQ